MKRLTEREYELLRLLEVGSSQSEICQALDLDTSAYVSMLDELTGKLDTAVVSNQFELDQVLSFERVRRAMLQAQLFASEARLLSLMDISPQAILVVDGRSGRITKANECCETMFGYTQTDLVGLNVDELLPSQMRDLHVKQRHGFLRSIRKREIGYHPPIFALRKDGSEVEIIVGLVSTTATEDVMVVCSLASNQ